MSENSDSKFGVISPEVWREQSGLEIFQKMAAGELPLPPIAKNFGYRLAEVEKGRVIFIGAPKTDYYNPYGTTHGGYIATLLDSAMACAVHSTLAAGQGSTSLEFKVNFVRPIFERTGQLKAIGETVNVGRQVATAEGKLIDGNGKLYAHATTTCFIFVL
ncbi:MAG: PaaI family thioesterase [Acidobacteriota bacterium]|nr:PaaI family thioesterase [Acidobacteriota bacterium]